VNQAMAIDELSDQKDGSRISVALTVSALRDRDGRVVAS
jgi:hypothetical protein